VNSSSTCRTIVSNGEPNNSVDNEEEGEGREVEELGRSRNGFPVVASLIREEETEKRRGGEGNRFRGGAV